jgi:hypothetical protein
VHRLKWDAIFLFVFFLGQFLTMLRRAYLAKRSKLNGIESIRQFFAINWIPLLYRSVVEWLIFFYAYRFWQASSIQWAISKFGLNIPFQVPEHRGLWGCLGTGIISSSLLDLLAMQDKIFGIPIPKFIKEQILTLPEVQQFVNTLGPKG